MKIRHRRRWLVMRKARASHLSYEWHNYKGVRYINVGIACPKHHHWWSTSIWFYTSLRPHRWSLLGRFPSYVGRYTFKRLDYKPFEFGRGK